MMQEHQLLQIQQYTDQMSCQHEVGLGNLTSKLETKCYCLQWQVQQAHRTAEKLQAAIDKFEAESTGAVTNPRATKRILQQPVGGCSINNSRVLAMAIQVTTIK
jgi:hypothetical protein